MRDAASVTPSTQNKVDKRRPVRKQCRLRVDKSKVSSARVGGRAAPSMSRVKKEEIQRSITNVAQAFANGFFAEVNCRVLPEFTLDQLAEQVYQLVRKRGELSRSLVLDKFTVASLLGEYVNKIYVGDFDEDMLERREISSMHIILYKTKDDRPLSHEVSIEGEKQNLACRWSLPHSEFESLWETLEFDLPLKSQLMQYVFTVIRFDKANIDRTVIHCNQTILFHGPPGCGKTTLCKGLAQKVSIRMKELFHRFYFYELNAGSLFSKWFSESSHNLSRIFDDIGRVCSDPSTFVVVLIDEIESLSMSRVSSLSANEPSDMLRVVNTLLTQIDRLKSFSNILVLATSNLIEIIDQALIDRSDLILFVGPPSVRTTLHIYQACFDELTDKRLVHPALSADENKDKLLGLAKLSQGLSGRSLRKLPMIAFSRVRQLDQFVHPEQLFKAMHQQLVCRKNTNDYLQQFHQ